MGRVWTSEQCSDCERKQLLKKERQLLRIARIDKAAWMRRSLVKVIPPLFASAHLRDFSRAFRAALLDFDSKVGLVLFGAAGRGKSHAFAALARYLILKHKSVVRITYEMFCLQIRDTYKQGGNKTELDVIRPLTVCDCLIVEDIGSTTSIGKNESDFSNRTFFVLLDSRLEACKCTFISTNKSRANLTASFDERIASRLSLFKWIGTGGEDKRQCGTKEAIRSGNTPAKIIRAETVG
jgi:DNA replication protein DnaC